MAKLLRKPEQRALSKGVRIVHDVKEGNTPLEYVGFAVIDLEEGAVFEETLTNQECCAVILTGKATVVAGEQTFESLGTRKSVFEKVPTDSVYITKEETYRVQAETDARIALCYAPGLTKRQNRLLSGKDIHPEHRGIKMNQRSVHNILPDSLDVADSLLVVEVYTESGNFSSYPPHKHDQDNLPHESFLEETYYHEQDPPQGFVFQRVYTDDRSLDETMTVEHGDVVLVPAGYHPVGVPDGYTSYYLNVMAGPKRTWKFYNDPAHEWILDREDS
ncbi:5-deoxy-glucuronate isomerase [Shouchella sp. JSM 1781072]|uniref:5-deoxy-glucuronate isomerase n=1 Tax=Shouchella sp. JSM 1781072 TaxID=3344581 RepID=UPI0035BF3BF0